MRSMNFEQREAAIKGWFKTEMATRFTLPKDINPVNVATDVIESVNANIPSGVSQPYFDHMLKEITKQVTRGARSRLLPVPKDFVDATRNASKSASEGGYSGASTVRDMDPYKITEKRVHRGEPIAEAFLHGRQRAALLERTSLTDADLDKYIAPDAHMQ